MAYFPPLFLYHFVNLSSSMGILVSPLNDQCGKDKDCNQFVFLCISNQELKAPKRNYMKMKPYYCNRKMKPHSTEQSTLPSHRLPIPNRLHGKPVDPHYLHQSMSLGASATRLGWQMKQQRNSTAMSGNMKDENLTAIY